MKEKPPASKIKAKVKKKIVATANNAEVNIPMTANTAKSVGKLHNLNGYAMELWLTNLVLQLFSPQDVSDKKSNRSPKLLSFKLLQETHSLAKDFEKLSRHILPDLGVLILATSTSVLSYLYYLKKLATSEAVKAKELQHFISKLNKLSPHPILSVHSNLASAKSAAKQDYSTIKKSAASNHPAKLPVETQGLTPLIQAGYIRELHNLLEMAFIYGCSLVKIGVRTDEVEHAIYDYLNAKTFHSVETRIKVESYQPVATSGAPIEYLCENAKTITEASVIKISLEIRWFGLEADFVRMLGMNNFRLRPNIRKTKLNTSVNEDSYPYLEYFNALEERYNQTAEVLGMIVTQLSIVLSPKKTLATRRTALQKVTKLIDNPKKTKSVKSAPSKENSFFKAPLYILELRILSVSPHYEHVAVETLQVGNLLQALLSPSEVVFVRLTDISSGIIMGNVLLEDNHTVAILPEHGNHYLEFPW